MRISWFTGLWVAAIVIALVSGKAYFRGTIRRDDDPRQYWITVGCYGVLALLEPLLVVLRWLRQP